MSKSSEDADPHLRATLFGTFRLELSSGEELEITGKRARALLAILCLTPGLAVERARLCELLWQGRFQTQARASLRQTLLGLKKQLASVRPGALEITRDSVAFSETAIRSDLADLEAALANRDYSRAIERLGGIGNQALLERFRFGEEFERWLAGHRAQIEQRLKYAVEEALADSEQRDGDPDPIRSRLGDAWRLRLPETAGEPPGPVARIGVLPFRTDAADEASRLMAQGMFDELATTLGKVSKFLIAGRGSSINLARSDRPLSELAQALHVAYLVLGSVRREGDDLRVHISLVDGNTGFERWSQGYCGTSGNLFSLQDDIARAVSREISSALATETREPLQRQTTSSPSAYDRYLQGRALTMRAIGDGVMARAVELLEDCVAIDPEFAAAWTALAEAHAQTAVYTPCLDRLKQSERMAECARRAIDLEPAQGHARALLGIHRWTENDPAGALHLAHEAYRLEPDNPEVTLRLGSFLLYIGRTREAKPYIEAAIDLDPVNGRNFAMLSVACLNLGDIVGAIEAGQRMVDLGLPSMWLAVATAATGDHDQAVKQYRQTRHLMNTVIFPPAGTRPLTGSALDTFWRVAARGVCSGRAVHRAIYCATLDYLHKTLPDASDASIVAPAIWMGYSRMVFKTLGAQITPANMYCLMSLWADFEPIRRTRLHPEFLAFARRIGLVAAWEIYGWPDLLPRPDSI